MYKVACLIYCLYQPSNITWLPYEMTEPSYLKVRVYAYTHMNPYPVNRPLPQKRKTFWERPSSKASQFQPNLAPDHFGAHFAVLTLTQQGALKGLSWLHEGTGPKAPAPFICVYSWSQSGHVVLILHLRKGSCTWTWPLVEP